jgi:hypothetical protein
VLTHLPCTGSRSSLAEPDDVVNARVARAAAGRTAGEVLEALEGFVPPPAPAGWPLSDEQLGRRRLGGVRVIAESSYATTPSITRTSPGT